MPNEPQAAATPQTQPRAHRKYPPRKCRYCSTVVSGPHNCRAVCGACGRVDTDCCFQCRCCERCGCGCIRCKACTSIHRETVTHNPKAFCATCGHCGKFCKCHKAPHWINVQWKAGPKYNMLARPVGLEVELAEWGRVRQLPGYNIRYSVARDSSVVPSGAEMVLAPMSGDQVLDVCESLGRLLAEGEAKVNHTCGLHVHVGAQDLSVWDIRRLLTLWCKIEKDVFGAMVADKTRQLGRYCHPITTNPERMALLAAMQRATSTKDLKLLLNQYLYELTPLKRQLMLDAEGNPTWGPLPTAESQKRYSREVARQRAAKYSNARYDALNIHSWMYRTTVEYRLHDGTLDPVEILNWTLFCAWLTEAAVRLPEAVVREEWDGLLNLRDLKLPRGTGYLFPDNVNAFITQKMEAAQAAGELVPLVPVAPPPPPPRVERAEGANPQPTRGAPRPLRDPVIGTVTAQQLRDYMARNAPGARNTILAESHFVVPPPVGEAPGLPNPDPFVGTTLGATQRRTR